ncbi:MAG: type II toxin-antitoxin system RelB/DinJ family antitoxin [Firmicutes bacterium]|nr:type II toxin-antitoxin system RelB/DinJ family antitoxin [Bacillota bacterium]
MEKTFLQVRTNPSDKEQASAILEELGTNLSAVVNMLLKQIILTKGIPFDVKMPQAYTAEEKVEEIRATMEMEGLSLEESELQLLRAYQQSKNKEDIRQQLLTEFLGD